MMILGEGNSESEGGALKALHDGCRKLNFKKICRALAKGADANGLDRFSQRPMMNFIRAWRLHPMTINSMDPIDPLPFLEALVFQGANMEDIGFGADPALYYALEPCSSSLRKGLLYLGANVNAPRRTAKTTPLHMATLLRNSDAMKDLLEHGADVNAKCLDDSTALHLLASGCFLSSSSPCSVEKCFGVLMEFGADENSVDINGLTAMDLNSHPSNVEVLFGVISARDRQRLLQALAPHVGGRSVEVKYL